MRVIQLVIESVGPQHSVGLVSQNDGSNGVVTNETTGDNYEEAFRKMGALLDTARREKRGRI